MDEPRKILVILDPDAAPGFQLAGAEVWSASNEKEAENLIQSALESRKFGIVIIEEDFVEKFPPKLQDQILDSTVPLVLTLAIKRTGQINVEEYLENIIRRVTGYHIKVRA